MRLKSSLASLLFPPEASRGLRIAYAALYAVIILLAFWMIVVWRYASDSNDTREYLLAAANLPKGLLDVSRPPAYPAVLAILMALFGTKYIMLVNQCLMWALFILSVIPFRLAAQRLMPRAGQWWIFAAVALYALNPGIIYYNDMIRSETPSVVMTSFFLATLLSGVTERRTPSMIKAVLWLSVMIMTKPVFICFIPIYIVVLIVMRVQVGPSVSGLCRSGALGIVGVIALCAGYTALMNQYFGIHSLTDVSTNNTYFIFREADLVHSETAPTNHLADCFRKYNGDTVPDTQSIWDLEYRPMQADVTYAEMEEYVNYMLRRYPDAVANTMIYRFTRHIFNFETAPWDFFMYRFGVDNFRFLSLGMALILLLVIGVALLVYWIRRRRLPLPLAVVWAMPTVLLISNILGAQAEYSRLFTPCVGVFTLLLVCLTQKAVTILHAKLAH